MKKLGFGLMRLPLANPDDSASIDFEQTCKMVDAYMQNGFSYFDTAYMYHGNQSEIIAREAIVKRFPRDSFTLTTKLPMMYVKKTEDLQRYFDEQLEKCGVSYFDNYLLHNLNVPRYQTAKEVGAFDFIRQLKEKGLARRIGFSYHEKADLLDTILTENPDVELVQLQINYLDWDNDIIQSRRCYEVCSAHNKSVIVMEPVKGGMLAKLPDEAEAVFTALRPQDSIASWAIRFAANLPNVEMVLSGMTNKEQLMDNMSHMDPAEPLSAEEMAAINKVREIVLAQVAISCTACGYCVEGCPQNIPIPRYFTLYNTDRRDGWQAGAPKSYTELTQSYGTASACVACGSCETTCPQQLPIIKHMAEVSARFDQ